MAELVLAGSATLSATALSVVAAIGPEGWSGLVALAAVVIAACLLGTVWLRPGLPIRVLLWLPLHVLYRIRVHGSERIPATGPVLMVCNHVSFVDAFLIFFAQKRPVRFIIWAAFLRVPGLRIVLRWAQVIPVDGTAGPRSIVTSLHAASAALNRGEVVCLFAEGGVTRTGLMLPFHRGLKQILRRSPVPVVPVCLDHVWGSIFSFHGGRFLWKWPQKIPYPVDIAFGEPLPPTTTAFEVRQAIQLLSARCATSRRPYQLPVHRQFVRMACRHPFRRCLVDLNNKGKCYRYGTVLTGAMIFRQALKVKLGDQQFIGLWLPPSAAVLFANLALTLLGKTTVNLNYTCSTAAIQSAVRQCGIRTVLTSKLFVSRVKLEVEPGVEIVYLEEFRREFTWARRLCTMLAVVVLPAVVIDRWLGLHKHQLDDLATIIFSSGTTGDPKGVMLSHANLVSNTESVIQAIDPRPSDRLLGVLPFFHSFGYTVTFWLPLQVGCSIVYFADPRQAKEIGELCEQYQCTLLVMTPTFLRFCLRRCEDTNFRSIRMLICGAEKLPAPLADEFEEKFSVRPLEGYGCTELSPVVSTNVPDWELGGTKQIGNKIGTIGQPLPGVAARIVDPDTFAPLGLNQAGLLLIYGGNVMTGYLNRPDATASVMHDGWYITGDIGRIDADGFITLTDRLSRFSKIGGEMVPHQKIEDEVHHILGTAERVCVVTGVPDDRKGERLVVLHTVLDGKTVPQIWKELIGSGLPNLWVPAERDFFAIPELPVLGSGKLDLKRVKELALEKTAKAA